MGEVMTSVVLSVYRSLNIGTCESSIPRRLTLLRPILKGDGDGSPAVCLRLLRQYVQSTPYQVQVLRRICHPTHDYGFVPLVGIVTVFWVSGSRRGKGTGTSQNGCSLLSS